jgi:hypothetical protein
MISCRVGSESAFANSMGSAELFIDVHLYVYRISGSVVKFNGTRRSVGDRLIYFDKPAVNRTHDVGIC